MITDEIIKLYKLTGSNRVKLQGQQQLYERVLYGFTDEQKLDILRDYMIQKSNKVYPSIPELRNFTQKYKKHTFENKIQQNEVLPKPLCIFQKPELRDLFVEVIKQAHLKGVCFSPYAKSLGLKFGNSIYISNGRFRNKRDNFRLAINEAKQQNKDYFEKFKNKLDFMEEATLAKYCGFDLFGDE